MYVYDCRIFRGSHSKDENDFISSFMLVYREDVPIAEEEKVYEVVKPSQLPSDRWVLKVKESGLLRVYAYMREVLKKLPHREDKVVMEVDKYDRFVQEWFTCYYNFNVEVTISYFFKALLLLAENQILAAYVRGMTAQQMRDRVFLKPIRVIDKPKNVEQFTLTEGGMGT
jgi:hypothetical protein